MLRADRTGLVVGTASLAAIGAIVAVAILALSYTHDQRVADIHSAGASLARVLSRVSYDELIQGSEQHGVLAALRQDARNDKLAYVSIVDELGQSITESAAGGILVPPARMPAEPSAWFGQTQLELPSDRGRAVEFRAPLLDAGELRGFVRLGYKDPATILSVDQLSLPAILSLPVILLVLLFRFLLRRQTQPIKKASRQLEALLETQDLRRLDVAASGEFGDFVKHVNNAIALADARIARLEQEQQELITSSKLSTYRKNRVESVLESLPEAIMILDEVGTITFANRKLGALFDVSPQVILAQPPQQWCDNPDILQLIAKYQGSAKARSFTETIRFNLQALNEKAIATRTYTLFSPKDPSDAIGTLIIFRDETQEALARQGRADFVAHLSHELKSPLNVLALYSESLLGDAGKTAKFRVEAANVIAEEVARLGSLINGLLSMTQIENGSLAPARTLVKLRDVAEDAFEEARHSAADKDYTFSFDAPKEMNPAYVDKELLRIAITNLLSNAVKYNTPGGEVRLTIDETDDAIQIRVADSGIGVNEEETARIFEKFYRSSDDRVQGIGGHGLGLALTKQIVELHHGTLSLNHEREKGAEFIINLWKEATAVKQAI